MKNRIILLGSLVLLIGSLAQARGRRPDRKKQDAFPDYNRMEIHHTQPARSTESAPQPVTAPAVITQRAPTPADMNPDPMIPKPPPTAIPMARAGDYEPPLPEALSSTLVSTAPAETAQPNAVR